MKQISLTQGKVTLVDDAVYEWAKYYKWMAHKDEGRWYVQRMTSRKDDPNGKQHTIHLHREIMNCPKMLKIDHIDGNGLNNQRSNLRIVTNRTNTQNKVINRNGRLVGTSFTTRKYKDKIYSYWVGQIQINGVMQHLGYFKTEQEAHEAYMKVCSKLEK